MMNKQDELVSLIFKFGRQIRQNSFYGKKHDFSFFQTRVLKFIGSAKEPTMKEVADNFCVTCPSATAVIDRLAELKYIRRVNDAGDRRMVRLALTEKGRTTLDRRIKELSKIMEKMLYGLTEKEKADLNRILNKIINKQHEN